jgi:hypothetical protein
MRCWQQKVCTTAAAVDLVVQCGLALLLLSLLKKCVPTCSGMALTPPDVTFDELLLLLLPAARAGCR